ncbi:MAG: FAD-dependent oxidoreductase, partial [Betaproteobacteria bacterium]|nr:FAD-dependent oxidoreductase [Betaproteobacteria bacterium]
MIAKSIDVAILGAGPVGCTLALALERSGRTVALIERRAPGGVAPGVFRPIALSDASRLIIERLGAWDALDTTPINAIHVSQAGAFGRTLLSAADARVPALGHVIEYGALAAALEQQVLARGIALLRGANIESTAVLDDRVDLLIAVDGASHRVSTRCLAHAEGSSAQAFEKRYGFDAVVGRVRVNRSLPGARATAFERFTAEGPLALLPTGDDYGLVWSARPERAAALLEMAATEFVTELAQAFGTRAGHFGSVEARGIFPLVLRRREARIAPRQVFVGNAAQALHPVAGQGLNLGLRDAWDLANGWHEAEDIGSAAVLEGYARARRFDAAGAIGITDFLASAFLGHLPLASTLRGLALGALDLLPPARRFFARRMLFG